MMIPEAYPYRMAERPSVLDAHLKNKAKNLFSLPLFKDEQKKSCLDNFSQFLDSAKEYFRTEEEARSNGVSETNLFYHGKDHAIYQTTSDALGILSAVLSQDSPLSKHITPEGAYAGVIGAMFHDVGYVYGAHLKENYAGRTPIHVDESMKAFSDTVDKIGLPDGFREGKVKLLGTLGIHATHFPHTAEHEKEARSVLDQLPPEMRKEAQIIRLLVQFADLGGQTARIDYFPEGVKALREELNHANSGKGTEIIGTNDELAKKAKGFIEFVVEKTVGKTGAAILKEGVEDYVNRWNLVKSKAA